jgi:hypothetical protein
LQLEFFKNKKFYFFIIATLLIITHFSLIIHNPLLNYDDHTLIDPILSIHSISDYFKFISIGQIPDVQPVRDLSFFLTGQITPLFSFFNFHSVNLIFWFIALFYAHKILNYFIKNSFWTITLLFFYALSPVSSSSLAWISAQKHVLATMFILMATAYSLRSNPKSIITAILFSLSVFSQPINILWPFWFFIFKTLTTKNIRDDIKNIFFFLLPSTIISFIALFLNTTYYQSTYVRINAGIDKFDPQLANDFGARFLALGRYTFLSLFPFDALPSPHYIGSIQNIIGLVITVLLFFIAYLAYKKNRDTLPFLFLLYFLFPLIAVTYKITRIFCSDTYLLNASFGIYLFIAYSLSSFNHKALKTVTILSITLLSIFNFYYVQNFSDSLSFWTYSNKKEATPDSTVALAKMYVDNNRFDEAELLIRRIHDWQPDNIDVYGLAVRNVFLNPKLSDDYKIKRLQNFKPQKPITHFFLSILYANNKNLDGLYNELPLVFESVPAFLIDLGDNKEKVIGTYLKICEIYKSNLCEKSFVEFKTHFSGGTFDDQVIKHFKELSLGTDGKIFF